MSANSLIRQINKNRDRLKPATLTATANADIPLARTLQGGVVYGNAGATGAVTLKLPPATPGARVKVIVEAAQAFRLDPQDSEIIFSTAGVTNTAGKYIGNSTVGSYLQVIALRAGQWKVELFNGTWATEA